MIKFWAICQNTFIQTIRQPIFGILTLVTFAVLMLNLPLAAYTMGQDYHLSDQNMLQNIGLSTLLISGLFVAAFSAASVLSREIEDRTALTVISKPVSRATFVLGKFAGVTAAVTASFYLCGLVFLMTIRQRVMSAASDPYDMPVIVLGLSALGGVILIALLGNLVFGWHFSSAGVWSALVLLTIAMSVITFVGKGWTVVPPGYDVPPKAKPGIVKVQIAGDLEDYPPAWFKQRAVAEGFKTDSADPFHQTVNLKISDKHTLEDAVAQIAAWQGVAGAGLDVDPPAISSQLLIAMLLMYMAIVIFAAVAIAASTRLGTVLTLLVCLGIYTLGSYYPHISARAGQYPLLNVVKWLAPNMTFFYGLDALMRGENIPLAMAGWFGLYCVVYVAGVLSLGIALFQNRQLEGQAMSASLPGMVGILAWLGRAAAIALAMVGLVIGSLALRPDVLTVTGNLLTGGVLLLAGAAAWALWGFFGRGTRWSYWLVLVLFAAGLAYSVLGFLVQAVNVRGYTRFQLGVAAAVSLAVLLILSMPKTRHHFAFIKKPLAISH